MDHAHTLEMVLKELENISFIGISKDASNHGAIKMFPVLIQFFSKTSGVVHKLIELKSVKNETAVTISDFLN